MEWLLVPVAMLVPHSSIALRRRQAREGGCPDLFAGQHAILIRLEAGCAGVALLIGVIRQIRGLEGGMRSPLIMFVFIMLLQAAIYWFAPAATSLRFQRSSLSLTRSSRIARSLGFAISLVATVAASVWAVAV